MLVYVGAWRGRSGCRSTHASLEHHALYVLAAAAATHEREQSSLFARSLLCAARHALNSPLHATAQGVTLQQQNRHSLSLTSDSMRPENADKHC